MLGGISASQLAFAGRPMVTLYSAKAWCKEQNPVPPSCRRNSGNHANLNLRTSKWYGDDGTNPLLNVETCTITPHMAGPTWDNWPKTFRNGFDNILRVHAGRSPLWVVPELRDLVK